MGRAAHATTSIWPVSKSEIAMARVSSTLAVSLTWRHCSGADSCTFTAEQSQRQAKSTFEPTRELTHALVPITATAGE
jgi:hypothetical protein